MFNLISDEEISKAKCSIFNPPCNGWDVAPVDRAVAKASYEAGFNDGVVKTTDAAHSTFSAQLEEARREAKQEGIKTVVEWINRYETPRRYSQRPFAEFRPPEKEWHTFLKQHGMEG